MTDPRGEVRLALADFLSDPQTHGRNLRKLADSDWDTFAGQAEPVIEAGEDCLKVRYLLAIYSSRSMLVPYLARLMAAKRDVGRRVTRLAARIDPELDRSVARAVLGVEKGEGGAQAQTALLEVLAESDRLEQIIPTLDPLRESGDPKVRSKMALLVGRAARAQSWIKLLREDPDARVRANAIESLWSQGGAFAAVCYELGIRDEHQRVVANSLVGMYLLGDPRSISLLAGMAEHPEKTFRGSAAWAMGETRDGRFVPVLWRMRRGGDPELAEIAASSCEKILLAQATSTRTAVEIHPLGAYRAPDGSIQCQCVVLGEGRTPVSLREIDWRPKVNRLTVWRYSVRQVEGLPRQGIALVFPIPGSGAPASPDGSVAAFAAALREGFRSKRGSDALSVAFYSEQKPAGRNARSPGESLPPGHEGPARSGREHGPIALDIFSDRPSGNADASIQASRGEARKQIALTADLRLAVYQAQSPPRAAELEPGLLPAVTKVLDGLRGFLGGRHLVIVADRLDSSLWGEAESRQLMQEATASCIACHVLYTPALAGEVRAWMVEAAVRTGGFRMQLTGLSGLESALPVFASAVARHYSLVLHGATVAEPVDFEIASPSYSGHARLTVDPVVAVGDLAPDINWERASPLCSEIPAESAGGRHSGEPTAAL